LQLINVIRARRRVFYLPKLSICIEIIYLELDCAVFRLDSRDVTSEGI
jgi:hypothetical protein